MHIRLLSFSKSAFFLFFISVLYWGRTVISSICFVLVKVFCYSVQTPESKQFSKRRVMPAHGLRDAGHHKGKIRWQECVVSACYMTLAENRAWAENSQPGTPQSPHHHLTSARQIPCPEGSMTFGHCQQLRTNCIDMSLWRPFYYQTVNMPTQNLLDLFHPPKPVAKIVIFSDFCPIPWKHSKTKMWKLS